MKTKNMIKLNNQKFSNEKFVKFMSPKEDKHYEYADQLIANDELKLAFFTFWLSEGKAGGNTIVSITDKRLIISSKRYLFTKHKQFELKKASFSYKEGTSKKITIVKVEIGKLTQRFKILKSGLEEFKNLVSK